MKKLLNIHYKQVSDSPGEPVVVEHYHHQPTW